MQLTVPGGKVITWKLKNPFKRNTNFLCRSSRSEQSNDRNPILGVKLNVQNTPKWKIVSHPLSISKCSGCPCIMWWHPLQPWYLGQRGKVRQWRYFRTKRKSETMKTAQFEEDMWIMSLRKSIQKVVSTSEHALLGLKLDRDKPRN